MSEPSNSSQGFKPLADEAFVYRALLRQFWLNEDTGAVKRDAYYLRFDRNEIGLSVNLASACSPQDCAARFKKCYGVASLSLGDIRRLGLNVVQDSVNHANIVGLPYRETDRLAADRYARLLAQASQVVWRP
ncbi:MAG: hypothetical protein HC936_15550 [Leptolyngbyaceae cyanobacterium SU_3_3]|nr:hypothetical protein [Leptolyngbyaceae cyanobacterium SU_3_3]NJR53077.1 hypothetical protein [Leptolyngbyaceae cyanobacterium CSU_1_3]